MKIEIQRYQDDGTQTLGLLKVIDETEVYKCHSLEKPWKDNAHSISCIPKGEYDLIPHQSAKFGNCIEVTNVTGRDAILIHKGNFHSDTHGCILPGVGLADINKDGFTDVTGSKAAFNEIMFNFNKYKSAKLIIT